MCAFLKCIGPTKAYGIDAAIDEMFGSGNQRSSKMNDFGVKIFFSKGISNLKQVSAGEWMGVVFCLVILAMSEEGITLLQGRFDNSEDDDHDVDGATANVYVDDGTGDNNENVDIVSTTDFIELLESFLAFYAWYKKDDYWSVTNAAYAKGRATMASNSLDNMMDTVKRVLPRKEGNGWGRMCTNFMICFI
jgi:hypothetical protein